MAAADLIFLLTFFYFATAEVAPPTRGKLKWSDEFNSIETFNCNWDLEQGGEGWGNNELQFYTTRNHYIENGNLVIAARKESRGTNKYTSSRIKSKHAFKYGVFEMRAMLPKGRGTWPAFWLLSAKRPLSWPLDGEIDVMEHVGYDPNRIHGTIHCAKYNHQKKNHKGNSTVVNDVFGEYHNYTLDWGPRRIDVLVDGNLIFRYDKEEVVGSYESWPFDNAFEIILNLAVGGNWGGKMGIDDAVFPAFYKIDYVRVYESLAVPNENNSIMVNNTLCLVVSKATSPSNSISNLFCFLFLSLILAYF